MNPPLVGLSWHISRGNALGLFSRLDVDMNASKQKVVQYLNEARTSEVALVRTLQAQIGMTPRGSYRSGLETHLNETRKHATQVGERLESLWEDSSSTV